MGIVVRQSIKYTIISYIGVGVGAINTLWLYPEILQPEEIGLLRTLLDATYLFLVFAQLGVVNICLKYFPIFAELSSRRNGFLFFILMVASLGFVSSTVVYLVFSGDLLHWFADKSPLLLDFKNYLIPLAFSMLFLAVLGSYSQAQLRILVPKFIIALFIRLLLSLSVILVYLSLLDTQGFIIAVVTTHFLALILLVAYLRAQGDFDVRPNFRYYDSKRIREMMTFGLFMLAGSGGSVMVGKIDTVMLSSLSGLASTGIYSIAYFIGVFIELPKRSIVGITTPLISRAWNKQNLKELANIYSKASINLLIAGGYLFIGVWLNIDSLFDLMPNSEIYREGKAVVLLIGILKLLDMATGNSAAILAHSKYYKLEVLLVPILIVMSVGTNYWLIPVYGITGAAIATLLSFLVYNLLRFLIIWFKIGLQPFTIQTVKIVMIFALVFYCGSLIPTLENPVVDISIRSIFITGMYWGLVRVVRPSEDMDQLIRSVIARIKSKFS